MFMLYFEKKSIFCTAKKAEQENYISVIHCIENDTRCSILLYQLCYRYLEIYYEISARNNW